MATKHYLSVGEIRQLIAYDPETGALTWKPRTPDMFDDNSRSREWRARNFNSNFAGTPALNCQDVRGVRLGAIWERTYKAHRVAFALYHGRWPSGEIDHINGDPSDNRIWNLRDVSSSVNMRNMGLNKRNKSGRTGVTWERTTGKWYASISINGKCTSLGRYVDFSDAVAAREAAEEKYGYHKNTRRIAKVEGAVT